MNRMEIDPLLMVKDFEYDLPASLIAQHPVPDRDMSRLMVMNRRSGEIRHKRFHDIVDYLTPGDLLIMNDVRVIPARLFAHRSTGARIEIFILDGSADGRERRVLMRPARRIRIGERLELADGMSAVVLEKSGKEFSIRLDGSMDWTGLLERMGRMPLPPYIRRSASDSADAEDRERYQTVFAVRPGAVAAPTAGLHFTAGLLERLRQKGVNIRMLTLWVGWGTFRPIESVRVADHRMDPEYYHISKETLEEIEKAKREQKRIFAVGTTTTRALESWAAEPRSIKDTAKRMADIFITPGYRFQVIDGLITNFHLPGSTLIMLVSAFAGRDHVLSAYRTAVSRRYRFYSYGDAMLIF